MHRSSARKLNRRQLIGTLLLVPGPAAVLVGAELSESEPVRLRGKLTTTSEDEAWLQSEDGGKLRLKGDEQTELVLQDERLKDLDFEIYGTSQDDGSFEILPIHRPALFAWVDGKRLRVTYYCDVCAIRTFSPSICMCCRENTRVDLVDPEVITR